jgi:hypothetical protein
MRGLLRRAYAKISDLELELKGEERTNRLRWKF